MQTIHCAEPEQAKASAQVEIKKYGAGQAPLAIAKLSEFFCAISLIPLGGKVPLWNACVPSNESIIAMLEIMTLIMQWPVSICRQDRTKGTNSHKRRTVRNDNRDNNGYSRHLKMSLTDKLR